MGSGSWTTSAYCAAINEMGFASTDSIRFSKVQDFYKERGLAKELDPYGVIRECRDTEEHPNTIPVILALDVTGSMGSAAKGCAAKLDDIMTKLYEKVQDVEFLMMGIGDLAFDRGPIQASQFESDIRILDQTAKIWFEGGGGPNSYESYTAAWYFGLHNTDLDCWKRGKKGIIITMGDEPLNPYLPMMALNNSLGNTEQANVETNDLYKETIKKFDIFHIGIRDKATRFDYWKDTARESWKKVLGQNYIEGKSDELDRIICEIVERSMSNYSGVTVTEKGVAW